MRLNRRALIGVLGLLPLLGAASNAAAATATEIQTDVRQALDKLLAESETARAVSEKAIAVLVFPNIVKAGLGIGGQYGEGALLRGDTVDGYYNIAGGSFGWQIGAQSFSQAMFFMNQEALDHFADSKGFEIGADANVALANEGLGYDLNSSTIQDPIIAFVFGQQGLMAGITIEGSKITRLEK